MLLQSDWLIYHTIPMPISKHPIRKSAPKCLRTSMKPRWNDRNISTQGQHATRVWPLCCDVLRDFWYWKSNQCVCPAPGTTVLHKPDQANRTSCNIHKCWLKNLISFKFETTTLNISQYVETGWLNPRNILLPTLFRYVVLKCCDHLARASPVT